MDRDEYVLKDYEIKANYLSGHHQRMWNRFNFFVTIETALFGGGFIVSNNVESFAISGLAIVGAVVSLIWLLVGAQDKRLLRAHEWHVAKAANEIPAFQGLPDFYPVGRVDEEVMDKIRKELDTESEQQDTETASGCLSVFFYVLTEELGMKPGAETATEPLKLLLLIMLPLGTCILWLLAAMFG
jgi:hypothetical protein